MTDKVLLGDISNGDYLSLALADAGQRPEIIRRYPCRSLEAFNGAVLSFLADNGDPDLAGAAFSTSGWEADGSLKLMHLNFSMDRRALADLLHAPDVHFLNDAVAKATAIPALTEPDYRKICGQSALAGHVIAVVDPGQGLGGALLMPDRQGGWTGSHCEAGHADFAAGNALEIEIFKRLTVKYGHVSRERLVSIPGMVDLWQCIAAIEDTSGNPPNVDEIVFQAGHADPAAVRILTIQTQLFAATVADFALFTGARGGIYLTGDWLTWVGDLFDESAFATRFCDKGRVSDYLRQIPVHRVTADNLVFLGLSRLFHSPESTLRSLA